MTERRNTSLRVLRVVGWAVLGLVLVLYIGYPVAMAVAIILVHGATHTGAYARYPDEYERRVLTFFDERLLPADVVPSAESHGQ